MRHAIRGVLGVMCLAATAAAQLNELATHANSTGVFDLGDDVAILGDVDGDGIGDYAYGDTESDVGGLDAGRILVRSGATKQILYEVYGTHAGAELGRYFAPVGDVDGDGVPDIAAASTDITTDDAILILSGVDGALIDTITGISPEAGLASDFDAAGDVNLNGSVDLLVGHSWEDVDGVINAGTMRVMDGSTGAELWKRDGTLQHDNWGQKVGGVGDVDGDGFADFGAGSSEIDAGAPNGGMVRVYSGQTGEILHEKEGRDPGDFMSAVSRLGDVNGDGFDDFLVGAHGWGSGKRGKVWAYSGATGLGIWNAQGSFSISSFGYRLASIADVSGDGLPDAVIGATAVESSSSVDNPGEVEIRDGLTGALILELTRDVDGDDFGWSLATGDTNGDGRSDVLVGYPGANGVSLYSVACGDFIAYGSGCAGSGGFTPSLALAGCATPGGDLGFTVLDALSGSTALLFVGFAPTAAPLMGGCTLRVANAPVILPVPVADGGGPGLGWVQFWATLPVPAPSISMYLQAFILDPGVPQGYAATNGLEVVID